MSESPSQVAQDAAGNTYIVGAFRPDGGTNDFDPGPGVYSLPAQGDVDGFAAKYTADGSLLWVHVLGGSGYDRASDLVLDAVGNAYVGGQVTGLVDLDPAATYPDNRDLVTSGAYVARFAADGALGWVWQSSNGVSWSDVADLVVDGTGAVVAAGSYPNPQGVSVTASVVKITPAGGQQWRDDIAGKKGAFSGRGLAADSANNVLLVGAITGTIDVDPGAGTFNLSSGGTSTVVEKLSPTGAFVWAKQLVGSGNAQVEGYASAVDATGGVYTAGYYEGKADFDPGRSSYTLTAPATGGMFVSKLDAAGNFVWAKGLGAGDHSACQLALDAAGGVYVSGSFQGSGDFNPGSGTYTLTSAGETDGFVMKLKVMCVMVVGDTTAEADETFALDLSFLLGGVGQTVRGAGTVTNDDTIGGKK